jgi:hypothetical protein
MIIIPGIYNAQTHIPGGNVQGQVITVGAILKVTERDRRPYPSDPGTPSEIWIDNTAAIGYVCKEVGPNGTVWDRLDVLGDYIAFGDNDPGVNADITWGYRPGSLRYARNSEILWICKDSTQGAAVWNVLSSGGSVVSVNGQTGVVQLYLDDLLDVDAPLPTNGDVLTWDSATSTWIALAPTGGGSTYTVDNGLTENPIGNFQLGGNLVQNTDITNAGNYLRFTQNAGKALELYSNNAESLLAERANTSRNTIDTVLRIVRKSTTNPLGIWTLPLFGASIDFDLMLRNGTVVTAGQIISKWDSPLSPVERSYLEFSTRNSGTLAVKMTIFDNGGLNLSNYGSGTIIGTPAYTLGVDASGNVVEFTASPTTGDSISPFLLMGG